MELVKNERLLGRVRKRQRKKNIAINAWQSEEVFHETGLRDLRKVITSDFISIPAGAKALEIGCGIGRLLKPLAQERNV